MNAKEIVMLWFKRWKEGDFLNLPITNNFKHTSPYGTISSKNEYINLVEVNKEKFLGHHFIIHDGIYENTKACVRYTAIKDDFSVRG